MSNREMADHIQNILLTKAAMGMGRKRIGMGEVEDIMEIYGRGGAKRGRPRKITRKKICKEVKTKNPWINFLCNYSNTHGISYAEAMIDPRVRKEYHKDTKYSKTSKKVKTSRKKCPEGKKIKHIKGYTRNSGKTIKAYKKCVAGDYLY